MVAWHEMLERRDMQIRPVGNGMIGADEIAWSISLRGSTGLYLRASASICGSSFLFLSLRIRSRPFAVLITLLRLFSLRVFPLSKLIYQHSRND
jgi:hypothetical protein